MTIQLHRADFAVSKALTARLKEWFEYHDNDNSNDTSDTILIETMESLQNRIATHFQTTPFFSIRTV